MKQHYWTTVLLVIVFLQLEVAAATRPYKRLAWSGRSITATTTTSNDDDKGKEDEEKEYSLSLEQPPTLCSRSSGCSDRALLSVARAATLSRGSSPFVRSSAEFLLLGDTGLVSTTSRRSSSATTAICNKRTTFPARGVKLPNFRGTQKEHNKRVNEPSKRI